MQKQFVLLLICTVFNTAAIAQTRVVNKCVIPGRRLEIAVSDSITNSALNGAHVRIITGRDTILMVTEHFGETDYTGPLPDSVVVMASYLGYQTRSVKVSIPSRIEFRLPQKVKEIGEIVVIGDMIAVVMKGDTVKFNAAAYKTIQGDPMRDIFAQLPGMKFSNGTLTYLGEPIQRITIDGKRLFGDDPGLALDNIRADDVVDIKVYKDVSDAAKQEKRENASTITVADVTTRSKPTSVKNITLAAAGGSPTDNAELLYDLSGNLTSSRVGERLLVNARASGLPRYSSSESINAQADMQYYLEVNKNVSINTRNEFEWGRNSKEQWSQREYFPSDDYADRDYYERSSSNSRRLSVSSYTSVMRRFKLNRLQFSLRFQYNDDLSRSNDLVRGATDGKTTANQQLAYRSASRSYLVIPMIGYNWYLTRKILFSIMAQPEISWDKGHGHRVDTLPTSLSQIYLKQRSDGRKIFVFSDGFLDFRVSKRVTLRLKDNLKYTDSHSERLAVDKLTGLTDVTNTYDFRLHDVTNRLSGEFSYRNNMVENGIESAKIDIGWERQDMQRDEKLPDNYEFPRAFDTFVGQANIKWKFSSFNNLSAAIVRQPSQMTLTNLRGYIDDSNPVMLRAGNPDLKMPVSNRVNLNLDIIKGSAALMVRTSYTMTENAIASLTRYFAQDTHLPQYDYTVPAGAWLTTPENLSGAHMFNVSVDYSDRLKRLRSGIDLSASYNFDSSPTFINETPGSVVSNSYSLSVGLNGTFSNVVMPMLSAAATYSVRDNGSVRYKSLQPGISAGLRALAWGRVDMRLDNDLRWNIVTPRIVRIDRFEVVTNASVGYRFGKNQAFSVKLQGFNLFDRRVRVLEQITGEYVETSYLRNRGGLGRYVMLRVEWKPGS